MDCIFCELKLIKHCDALQHSNHHTKERPYFCRFCAKEFVSRKTLKYHKDTHSAKPAQRKFKCSKCDSSFKRKYTLENHMTSLHSNNRPFKCKLFEKSFKTQNDLTRHHVGTHTDKYKCHQCGRTYKSSQYLNIHITTIHEKKNALRVQFVF